MLNSKCKIPDPELLKTEMVPANPTHGIGKMFRYIKAESNRKSGSPKRYYQSWKTTFLACIHSTPATGKYKLLHFLQYFHLQRQSRSQKVLDIQPRLTRRTKTVWRESMAKSNIKQQSTLKSQSSFEKYGREMQDIEEFSNPLDIVMINPKKVGQDYELGDGSQYIKLQRKLSEAMLASYYCWVFGNSKEESVIALRIDSATD